MTNVPKVRFKGFIDIWEQRKFSDGVSEVGDGLHGTPVYSDDGDVYFVNGNNLVDGNIVINSETKTVDENQQSVADKSLDDNTILMSINGTIGNLAYYSGEKLMLGKSAAYIKVSEFDKKFVYAYLQAPSVQAYFMDNITGTTIKNLGLKAIREMRIIVPQNIEEQNKIGEYFSILDNLITLHQRKCEETKELKSFMLQKMFPRNGELYPEVRFEGFTDTWEQRKLGELIEDGTILEQSDGNHGGLYPRSEEFTSEGIPYIAASSISSDGGSIDFNLTKYLPVERAKQFRKGVAKSGDVLLAHNATVGPSVMLSMDYEFAVLSTSLTLYRLDKEKMYPEFFLQAIRSEYFQKQLEVFMKQTTRSQVPILTQRNLHICYPQNIKEQMKIGGFFSNLDNLITFHQHKCDKLKEIKCYMLQNMFV